MELHPTHQGKQPHVASPTGPLQSCVVEPGAGSEEGGSEDPGLWGQKRVPHAPLHQGAAWAAGPTDATMEADTEGPWQGWSKPLEGKPLLSGPRVMGPDAGFGPVSLALPFLRWEREAEISRNLKETVPGPRPRLCLTCSLSHPRAA